MQRKSVVVFDPRDTPYSRNISQVCSRYENSGRRSSSSFIDNFIFNLTIWIAAAPHTVIVFATMLSWHGL